MKETCEKGPASASSIATPPEASAGKNFNTSSPRSRPASTPLGLLTPGMTGMPLAMHQSTTDGLNPGETMNLAPKSTAFLARSRFMTVPAPTTISGTWRDIVRMASAAASVLKVISMQGIPPSMSACARPSALVASSILTTGTTPISPNFFRTEFMHLSSARLYHIGAVYHNKFENETLFQKKNLTRPLPMTYTFVVKSEVISWTE